MYKLIVIFCLLLSLSSFAEETLDPEILPHSREHIYPMAPYHHIAIYSAPRTGSSLVYNVFRYLFETDLSAPHQPFAQGGSVRKTHDKRNVKELGKRGVLYVVPIRHPIHVGISRFRTLQKEVPDLQHWCKKQIERQAKFLHRLDTFKKEGYQILVLRYEELAQNFDSLFQEIERHFSLSLSERDKENIRKGYGKENVAAHLAPLSDFQEILPLSGFHGTHISPDHYAPPPELVHWLTYYLNKTPQPFAHYGYP